jgi:hypothetical protein
MLNYLVAFVIAMCAFFVPPKAEAGSGGFIKEKFVKVVYCKYGGSAANGGDSYDSAKPIVDGDLWAIPAGTVIEKVYVIVDTAVTGTTDIDVGDDDDADGFEDGSVSGLASGLGTPGMYGYSSKLAGAYLRTQTAGATDPADIDVVPNAKYYSATGKEVKLDATTANTAGAIRVVIEGYYAGVN